MADLSTILAGELRGQFWTTIGEEDPGPEHLPTDTQVKAYVDKVDVFEDTLGEALSGYLAAKALQGLQPADGETFGAPAVGHPLTAAGPETPTGSVERRGDDYTLVPYNPKDARIWFEGAVTVPGEQQFHSFSGVRYVAMDQDAGAVVIRKKKGGSRNELEFALVRAAEGKVIQLLFQDKPLTQEEQGTVLGVIGDRFLSPQREGTEWFIEHETLGKIPLTIMPAGDLEINETRGRREVRYSWSIPYLNFAKNTAYHSFFVSRSSAASPPTMPSRKHSRGTPRKIIGRSLGEVPERPYRAKLAREWFDEVTDNKLTDWVHIIGGVKYVASPEEKGAVVVRKAEGGKNDLEMVLVSSSETDLVNLLLGDEELSDEDRESILGSLDERFKPVRKDGSKFVIDAEEFGTLPLTMIASGQFHERPGKSPLHKLRSLINFDTESGEYQQFFVHVPAAGAIASLGGLADARPSKQYPPNLFEQMTMAAALDSFWIALDQRPDRNRIPTRRELQRYVRLQEQPGPGKKSITYEPLKKFLRRHPAGRPLPAAGFFGQKSVADDPYPNLPHGSPEFLEFLSRILGPFAHEVAVDWFDNRARYKKGVMVVHDNVGSEQERYVVAHSSSGLFAIRKVTRDGSEEIEIAFVPARERDTVLLLKNPKPSNEDRARFAEILPTLDYYSIKISGSQGVVEHPELGIVPLKVSLLDGARNASPDVGTDDATEVYQRFFVDTTPLPGAVDSSLWAKTGTKLYNPREALIWFRAVHKGDAWPLWFVHELGDGDQRAKYIFSSFDDGATVVRETEDSTDIEFAFITADEAELVNLVLKREKLTPEEEAHVLGEIDPSEPSEKRFLSVQRDHVGTFIHYKLPGSSEIIKFPAAMTNIGSVNIPNTERKAVFTWVPTLIAKNFIDTLPAYRRAFVRGAANAQLPGKPYSTRPAVRWFHEVKSTDRNLGWIVHYFGEGGQKARYIVSKFGDGVTIMREKRDGSRSDLQVAFVTVAEQDLLEPLFREGALSDDEKATVLSRITNPDRFLTIQRNQSGTFVHFDPVGPIPVRMVRLGDRTYFPSKRAKMTSAYFDLEVPIVVETDSIKSTPAYQQAFIRSGAETAEPASSDRDELRVLAERLGLPKETEQEPYDPKVAVKWFDQARDVDGDRVILNLGPIGKKIRHIATISSDGAIVTRKRNDGKDLEVALIGAKETRLVKLLRKSTRANRAALARELKDDRFHPVEQTEDGGYAVRYEGFGVIPVRLLVVSDTELRPTLDFLPLIEQYIDLFCSNPDKIREALRKRLAVKPQPVNPTPYQAFSKNWFSLLVRSAHPAVLDIEGNKYVVLHRESSEGGGYGLITQDEEDELIFSYVYEGKNKSACDYIDKALKGDKIITHRATINTLKRLVYQPVKEIFQGVEVPSRDGELSLHYNVEGLQIVITVKGHGRESSWITSTSSYFLADYEYYGGDTATIDRYEPEVGKRWLEDSKTIHAEGVWVHYAGDENIHNKYLVSKIRRGEGLTIARMARGGGENDLEIATVSASKRDVIDLLTSKDPPQDRVKATLESLDDHFLPIVKAGDEYEIRHPVLGSVAVKLVRRGEIVVTALGFDDRDERYRRYFNADQAEAAALPSLTRADIDAAVERSGAITVPIDAPTPPHDPFTRPWYDYLVEHDHPLVIDVGGVKYAVLQMEERHGFGLIAVRSTRFVFAYVDAHSNQAACNQIFKALQGKRVIKKTEVADVIKALNHYDMEMMRREGGLVISDEPKTLTLELKIEGQKIRVTTTYHEPGPDQVYTRTFFFPAYEVSDAQPAESPPPQSFTREWVEWGVRNHPSFFEDPDDDGTTTYYAYLEDWTGIYFAIVTFNEEGELRLASEEKKDGLRAFAAIRTALSGEKPTKRLGTEPKLRKEERPPFENYVQDPNDPDGFIQAVPPASDKPKVKLKRMGDRSLFILSYGGSLEHPHSNLLTLQDTPFSPPEQRSNHIFVKNWLETLDKNHPGLFFAGDKRYVYMETEIGIVILTLNHDDRMSLAYLYNERDADLVRMIKRTQKDPERQLNGIPYNNITVPDPDRDVVEIEMVHGMKSLPFYGLGNNYAYIFESGEFGVAKFDYFGEVFIWIDFRSDEPKIYPAHPPGAAEAARQEETAVARPPTEPPAAGAPAPTGPGAPVTPISPVFPPRYDPFTLEWFQDLGPDHPNVFYHHDTETGQLHKFVVLDSDPSQSDFISLIAIDDNQYLRLLGLREEKFQDVHKAIRAVLAKPSNRTVGLRMISAKAGIRLVGEIDSSSFVAKFFEDGGISRTSADETPVTFGLVIENGVLVLRQSDRPTPTKMTVPEQKVEGRAALSESMLKEWFRVHVTEGREGTFVTGDRHFLRLKARDGESHGYLTISPDGRLLLIVMSEGTTVLEGDDDVYPRFLRAVDTANRVEGNILPVYQLEAIEYHAHLGQYKYGFISKEGDEAYRSMMSPVTLSGDFRGVRMRLRDGVLVVRLATGFPVEFELPGFAAKPVAPRPQATPPSYTKFTPDWFLALPPDHPNVFYHHDTETGQLHKFVSLNQTPTNAGFINLLTLDDDGKLGLIAPERKKHKDIVRAINKTLTQELTGDRRLRIISPQIGKKLHNVSNETIPMEEVLSEGGYRTPLATSDGQSFTLKVKIENGRIHCIVVGAIGDDTYLDVTDYQPQDPVALQEAILRERFLLAAETGQPGTFVVGINTALYLETKDSNGIGFLTLSPDGRLLITIIPKEITTGPIENLVQSIRNTQSNNQMLTDYSSELMTYDNSRDLYSFPLTPVSRGNTIPLTMYPVNFSEVANNIEMEMSGDTLRLVRTDDGRIWEFIIPRFVSVDEQPQQFSVDWFQGLDPQTDPGAFRNNGQTFQYLTSETEEAMIVLGLSSDRKQVSAAYIPVGFKSKETGEVVPDHERFFRDFIRSVTETQSGNRNLEGYRLKSEYMIEKSSDVLRIQNLQTDEKYLVPFYPLNPEEGYTGDDIHLKILEDGLRIVVVKGDRTVDYFIPRPVQEEAPARESTPPRTRASGPLRGKPPPPRDTQVDDAIAKFNGVERPDFSSLDLEGPAVRTPLNTRFTAAKEPLPITMLIKFPGKNKKFKDLKDSNLAGGTTAFVWWGGEGSSAITYEVTRIKRGVFRFTPINGGLDGNLILTHDQGATLDFENHRSSKIYGWLDDEINGPRLSVEQLPGTEEGIRISGTPYSPLFREVHGIWSEAVQKNNWIIVTPSQEEDSWSLKVTYQLGDGKKLDALELKIIADLIDATAAEYKKSIEAARKPVWITEESYSATRKNNLPEGIDRRQPAEAVVSLTRHMLGRELQKMTIDGTTIRGDRHTNEDVNITVDGKVVSLPVYLTPDFLPLVMSVTRTTDKPAGKEVADLEIDQNGRVILKNHQFLVDVGEAGEPQYVEGVVESRPFNLPLDMGIDTAQPSQAVVTATYWGATEKGWDTLTIEDIVVRGQSISTSSHTILEVGAEDVSLPQDFFITDLPIEIEITRKAAKGQDIGWEVIELKIESNGEIKVASQEFTPEARAKVTNIIKTEVVQSDKTQTVDPFNLTLDLLENPLTGPEITGAALSISEEIADTLGIPKTASIKRAIKLDQDPKDKYTLTFNLGILGEAKYTLAVDRSKGGLPVMTATRSPITFELEWSLKVPDDPSKKAKLGKQMLAKEIFEEDLELDTVESINGNRYFLRKGDLEKTVALLKLSGVDIGFDSDIHETVEVYNKEGVSPVFVPVQKRVQGRYPVTTIIGPIGRIGPIEKAEEQFLRFLPGEVFVPTPRTLDKLDKNTYRERGTSKNRVSFSDSQYWYELEAVHSQVVFRVPFIWNFDRENRPWHIDTSDSIRAYVKGGDPNTAVILTNPRFKMHDGGGTWSIEFDPNEEEVSRGLKRFKIEASISKYVGQSVIVMGGVNLFNANGERDPTDDKDFRKDAHSARDQAVVDHFGRDVQPTPGTKLFQTAISIDEQQRVTIRFGRDAVLSGMTYGADHNRLRVGEFLNLTLSNETKTFIPIDAIRNPIGEDKNYIGPVGKEGVYHLLEVKDGELTGVVFEWHIALGLLFEIKTPSLMNVEYLKDYLSDHNFPLIKPKDSAAADLKVIPVAAFDMSIPPVPAADRSFAYPSGDIPEAHPDRIPDLIDPLDGEMFFPDEEALHTMVSQQPTTKMVFVARSGATLELPMRQRDDGKYIVDISYSDTFGGRNGRFIVPLPTNPSQFRSMTVKLRTKAGGKAELLVGPDGEEIPINFERITRTQTRNGNQAFGLFADFTGKKLVAERERAGIKLREWITYNELDSKDKAIDFNHDKQQVATLPSGRNFRLAFDRHPIQLTELDFEKDEKGRITRAFISYADENGAKRNKKMSVFRAHNSPNLYFLKDEDGRFMILDFDIVDGTNMPLLYERPAGIRKFLTAPESPSFPMIGTEGQIYTVDNSATARPIEIDPKDVGIDPADVQKVFEVRTILGRSSGVSEYSLEVEEGTNNARAKFYIVVGKKGEVSILPEGEILEEEGEKPPEDYERESQKADVKMERMPNGHYFVFLRTREAKDSTRAAFRDYAWFEFAAKKNMIDPTNRDDMTHQFKVSFAHYNKTNNPAIQRMPGEDRFLWSLAIFGGSVQRSGRRVQFYDTKRVERYRTKLKKEEKHRDALIGITETLADYAIVVGALKLCGVEEPDWSAIDYENGENGQNGNGEEIKQWWTSFASMLQLGRELRTPPANDSSGSNSNDGGGPIAEPTPSRRSTDRRRRGGGTAALPVEDVGAQLIAPVHSESSRLPRRLVRHSFSDGGSPDGRSVGTEAGHQVMRRPIGHRVRGREPSLPPLLRRRAGVARLSAEASAKADRSSLVGAPLAAPKQSLANIYFMLVRTGEIGLKDELKEIEMELTMEQRAELMRAGRTWNGIGLVATAKRILAEVSSKSPSHQVPKSPSHVVGRPGTVSPTGTVVPVGR